MQGQELPQSGRLALIDRRRKRKRKEGGNWEVVELSRLVFRQFRIVAACITHLLGTGTAARGHSLGLSWLGLWLHVF